MKKLKFTPENLERHKKALKPVPFLHGVRALYTTRNEKKGRHFEIFKIDELGYFLLEDIRTYYPNQRGVMYALFYADEGFSSPVEFRDEIDRIYSPDDVLYVHNMLEVFIDDH